LISFISPINKNGLRSLQRRSPYPSVYHTYLDYDRYLRNVALDVVFVYERVFGIGLY
jgi:hypothetical protein